MSQTVKKPRRRRQLTPGQKLLFVVVLLIVFGLCSTVFLDLNSMEKAYEAPADISDWPDAVTAYLLADEGSLVVPFYNEGLAVEGEYGRGTEIQLESWEPFVAENGLEYYHAFVDGQMGYVLCSNVTDDQSALLQEAQLYVRSTVYMMEDATDVAIGPLAQQGTLLRVMGYDYFKKDGSVNMYHVMMGEEFGWIKSEYVVQDYGESMTHWDEINTYQNKHVFRGDDWGGGDAGGLDYWPHEKGDFADQGNVMPEDVYAMYIPVAQLLPDQIPEYLEMAEGTYCNAFVVTIAESGVLAYDSPVYEQAGLMGDYLSNGSVEQCQQAVKMLKDAGYYVIGRLTTFQDSALANAKPEWSIANRSGQPQEIGGMYWPSPYSRDVWELKTAFAVEAVDLLGLNEIQFDYARFPDYLENYEKDGTVVLDNPNGESKAQAIQRFLTYATDAIHAHGAYVGADVFGETGNFYVAAYGQYWPAISDVVDVISGMPYPDHFGSFYENNQRIVPYRMPYKSTSNWTSKVYDRQTECASPAIVRTWIQTWDDNGYKYDSAAIQRQILALYDGSVPGGFMLWHGLGSRTVAEKLPEVFKYDYRALYEQAVAQGVKLSEYMKISTDDEQPSSKS